MFEALIPPLTDLVEQIKKYLDYYASHARHQHLSSKDSRIAKILLCGGGALLPGLPEFLTRELHIDVGLGDPWVNILRGAKKDIPPLSFADSLRFATALGLALRGKSEKKYD